MKQLDSIQNVFFIGIGGIGMSALARYFHKNGKSVGGYDGINSKMTKTLAKEGIEVIFEAEVEVVQKKFKTEGTLVVFTPAVAEKNPMMQFFKQNNFKLKKRAEVLGMISREMPTLAIAGTHGKTTTSAILAHLLKQSGYKITAFLGGVAENYNSNFIGDGDDALVVEADEFDRSFLQLSPDYGAITSVEPDHLDSYGNEAEMRAAFKTFAEKVEDKNHLFFAQVNDLNGKTVAVDKEADYAVKNIQVENGGLRFEFNTPDFIIENLRFNLPGNHNLLNAAIAFAMAMEFGANHDKLAKALASFSGVDRRFTYHLKTNDKVLIEDYAHHPTEIKAVGQAVAQMHPDQKILAVFQPHLFSRTRDFYKGFAENLDFFDQVLLLPIFPAREEAIEGITSEMIGKEMKNKNWSVIDKGELNRLVKNTDCSVIVLMGAGDIGEEAEHLKTIMS